MRRREAIEKLEDERLAPYASRSGRSAGRLVPEPPHAYRTEFQRDRDRILHSRAFRRLQSKTQVFPYHQGDHFRNRLTHTLEVAQIARTVARALGANEDLTEAIVLAHDLGHPPFGHAGERVLHELLAAHGGFEHNRQSLRIVDCIEERTRRYRGLNLTHETRAGLLKHGGDFPRYPHPVPLPPLPETPSVEAQIANLSDEIAYHSHDLDDGLRAGLLEWADLAQLELWRRASMRAREREGDEGEPARGRVIVAVIDLLVSDLIETSAALLADRPRGAELGFSQAVRAEKRDVAQYLLRHFYRHHEVIRMAAKAERILRELWQAYTAEPGQLPPRVFARGGDEPRERAVADYVAGMTDRFAIEEHRKLFDAGTRV